MATTKTIQSRQQQKYSTSTEWSNANPLLLKGEIAVVKIGNSYRFKVGDGTSKYNALPFVDEGALANKVDKRTDTSYIGQGVYGFTSDGSTVAEKTIFTDGQATNISGTIPLRITDGNIPVPETPINNTAAASKKYVDDSIPDVSGKLDKITSTDTSSATARVYSITNAGAQSTLKVTTNPTPNYLAQYRTGGILRSNTPSNNLDVANKKYVDDAVAGAGGGSSLRTATYVIASSDSLDDAKNAADLVIQTTEDTAAKLAAITFTADGPNPGTYYFAPGTYNIRSTTRVNCSGTYSFIGYGANFENADGCPLTIGDVSNSTTANVNFEGFKFTRSSTGATSGLEIDASFYGTVNINKCQFTGTLPVGLMINAWCRSIIHDCYFSVASAIQIRAEIPYTGTDYCNYIISNCIFKNYGNAISFQTSFCRYITITDNIFEASSTNSTAIYFESQNTTVLQSIISNNQNRVGKFIWSSTSTTRTWSNVNISNNISSPNATAYDVCLYGIFTDVVISDNNCKYGIKLWTRGSTSTNLTVKGNRVSALSMHAGLDDYTTGSFKNVVITGNLITGQYYSNIGGSRWALNKGSIIDGNSIYKYHSTPSSLKDDYFYVSGNGSESWASSSQVMFGNNIDNA